MSVVDCTRLIQLADSLCPSNQYLLRAELLHRFRVGSRDPINHNDQTMPAIFKNLLLLFIILTLSACSLLPKGSQGQWAGYTESGQASFYADKFQHRKTASGELYKHHLKTAAHKQLPFGTRVKVTNRKNGKSVIVKINDRGPFVKGRVIDLSKSAFSAIGSPASGLLHVKITVLR